MPPQLPPVLSIGLHGGDGVIGGIGGGDGE